MAQEKSCLVERLSHYIDLSGEDLNHIARLEKEERSFRRGDTVQRQGVRAEHLFVVKKGWAYSYSTLADGQRQIVRIHHPGDMLGFPDIAFERAWLSVHALEDIVLCPFPKSALDRVFVESPRLTALLFSLSLREQVSLLDTVTVIGQMSARGRIAYLLLDLHARLRITNRHITDTFRLPLNQSEIGDALGLTNVYISKVMAAFESEGLIARSAGMVRLARRDELVAICEFTDRYGDLDTSWFPASGI